MFREPENMTNSTNTHTHTHTHTYIYIYIQTSVIKAYFSFYLQILSVDIILEDKSSVQRIHSNGTRRWAKVG